MLIGGLAAAAAAATAVVLALAPGAVNAASVNGMEVLHGAHLMGVHGSKAAPASTVGQLSYHGGNPGVETGTDRVFVVFWGAQWNGGSGDASGEAAIIESFYGHVAGSAWNNSVTQYCEGVSSGTVFCNGGGTAAANGGALGGVWFDGSSLPRRISQSAIASEASKAATHFGTPNHAQVQYVVATPSGHSESGFGTQWCAYHSSTSNSGGTIAYTYLPYITDAGASCGANFNGLGAKAGITIVGGHEFAETESDIYPNGGWLDSSGAENGDKCAWISSGQGAAANVTLNGATFPVQSLWSNAFNNQTGGCVLAYP
jgi:serine protease